MKIFIKLMIIMFLASCENEAEKSQDEKTAESIWQEINGYESWPQASEWSGVMASIDGTHGSFVQIWINDVAMPSFQDSISSELPFASLLVKEGYSDNNISSINNITVMKKIEGYDPDHGDWFWASFSKNGEVNNAGSISSCYNCHASGTDFIRFSTH